MAAHVSGVRSIRRVKAPVDANVKIEKGEIVVSTGNGFIRPGATATGLTVLGRAREAADNTGGSAGAKSIFIDLVREVWCILFENDTVAPVEATHRFGVVYLKDARTVSSSSASNARSQAGRYWYTEDDGLLAVEAA